MLNLDTAEAITRSTGNGLTAPNGVGSSSHSLLHPSLSDSSVMLNPHPTSLKQRKNTASSIGSHKTSGTTGTTATGPIEEVLPWELGPLPLPPSSNGTGVRKSEDTGEKERFSKRDFISSKFKSKRPSTLAPLKQSRQTSQGYTLDNTTGLPPTNSYSSHPLPPISPSRRSMSHSERSGSRSSGDWNTSPTGAGGGRHGSMARSPPSRKVDLPTVSQRAPTTNRSLTLTGPVEEVTPWEVDDKHENVGTGERQHHHLQGPEQSVKSRSSLSLGGQSTKSHNQSQNYGPPPSPSFFFGIGGQALGAGSSSSGNKGPSSSAHGKSGSYHQGQNQRHEGVEEKEKGKLSFLFVKELAACARVVITLPRTSHFTTRSARLLDC